MLSFLCIVPHGKGIKLILGILHDTEEHTIYVLLLLPLLFPREYVLVLNYEHLHCAVSTIQYMLVDAFQHWMLSICILVLSFPSSHCSLVVTKTILLIIFS